MKFKKQIMQKLKSLFFILSLIFISSCGSENKDEKKSDSESKTEQQDQSEPKVKEEDNQDWIDVQSKVSRMNNETTYPQIIELLGKPYDEYATPSLPEETILFYNVPGVNGAIFWVMINTESKTFLYWSGEKNEK